MLVGNPAVLLDRNWAIRIVGTRGVNRSPKILDLRESSNPIRTSVGQPIFPWTIFGQVIIAKHTHSRPLCLWSTIQ